MSERMKMEILDATLEITEKGFSVISASGMCRKFDDKGKNADKALLEINHARYGLPNRTGVDFQKFNKNRMSKKDLSLSDKDVFPNQKELFKLGSHDLSRTLRHTKVKK